MDQVDNLANAFANKIKTRFGGTGGDKRLPGPWAYTSTSQMPTQQQRHSQPGTPSSAQQQGPSNHYTYGNAHAPPNPNQESPQGPPPQYHLSSDPSHAPPPLLPRRPGSDGPMGKDYRSTSPTQYSQSQPHTSGYTPETQHVQGGYPIFQSQGQSLAMPPSINSGTRPAGMMTAPPAGSSTSSNADDGADAQHHGTAGVLYPPGTYPTPELFPFPLTRKHTTLMDPSSYTSNVIQEALDTLGPHATLYLLPSSRWSVSSTIRLQPHQELATFGYPTGENEVAWLDAEQGCNGQILRATDMPGVRIRNIGIDGGREKYGYNKDNECMVQLGHDKGYNQHIDHCFLRHPRQWSCLQVFQGCEGVRVTNNFIGPAGYPESDLMQWADGISYAGQNGLIAGNYILDATDGGVVIFSAPGTLVTSNTIVTRNRVGLGAINMVDYSPHDGNYVNTRVIHNTIRIEGSYLRIGIGQGGSVWFTPSKDGPRNYNRGATVMYNRITSRGPDAALGYGFPVSDVEDWICMENSVASAVVISGDMSKMSRDPRSLNIGPGAFVCSNVREGQGPRSSSLQEEFVSGPIGRLIDINPGKSSYRVFCPGQLCLPMGQSLSLTDVELAFDWDGGVRVKKSVWDFSVLWTSGSAGRIGETTSALLIFEKGSGKLFIIDQGQVIYDLTPSIPSTVGTAPHLGGTFLKNDEMIMMFSDMQPNLMLASIVTGSIFWAPMGYQVGYQWTMTEGDGLFVCQTSVDRRNTLLSTMNPLGQFVVLQTVSGATLPRIVPPTWPLDEQVWRVVWKSHEVPTGADNDLRSHIIFQADGHLVSYVDPIDCLVNLISSSLQVVYSGKEKGRPLWGSGTSGWKPPAKYLRWGSGSQESPYLSCVTEDGKALWSTHGKSVG
ncbi:hypothetical protein FRB98_007929 [Tulasnella sp. 332]|nr:hypothetical protein FRB98_007929 [Tulasnella sp. 332]